MSVQYVGTAIRLWNEGSWGSNPSTGRRFLFSKGSDRLWFPYSLVLKGYWGPSPRVKPDVNRSPPSSAKVINKWSYTPIPHICLHGLGWDDSIFSYSVYPRILTLRRLMSYIYMEHPFLMFLDHTQRRSTVGRTPLDE